MNRSNGTDIFSLFFSVFIVPRNTFETLFGVRLYIYSNFLAGINLRSLKSDSGIQFTVKWPKLQQIILVSTTFI